MKNTLLKSILLFVLFSGSINCFSQSIPELLYYKFDSTGNTVPNFASSPPAGTTIATLMGGLTQGSNGKCGGAVIGTGVSSTTDYVNTGWATNLSGTSWTISFWTSNITPSATLFYIFGDVGAGGFRCFTNGVAGPNNWVLRGTGITDVYANGAATVASAMTTFVYDMTLANIKAYMNGVLINTVAQGTPVINGGGPFKVIGYSTNVGCPLNGLLDEFRVYNHALNAQEVMNLYTSVSATASNDTICEGESTTLIAANASNFSWEPGNLSGNNLVVTPLTTTTYTVTGSDAGCAATSTVLITVNSTPAPTPVTATPSSYCVTGNSDLNATAPGYNINWYTVPSGGVSIGSSTSGANFNVSPLTTTTYYAEAQPIAASPISDTFNFTGAMQTFTVPAGVTSVDIVSWGAQGGNAIIGGTGGLGGMASGTLAVTPGQVLNIFVGGQNGFNGGGTGAVNGNDQGNVLQGNAPNGGGASDVRVGGTTLLDRVITAGGGGGAGYNGVWQGCQVAGPAGNGGDGGGSVGTNGTFGVGTPCNCAGGGGDGGAGGTQLAGGVAGGYHGNTACLRASWTIGANGTLGVGGSGSLTYHNGTGGGGGGGGGHYGGGSGGSGSDTTPGGGGGGGSSNTDGVTAGATTAGVKTGDGRVTITYTIAVPAGCTSYTRTPVTVTVNTAPPVTASATPNTTCNNTSVTPMGGGAQSYAWSGGLTDGTAFIATTTDTYTVTGTDANGCTATSTVTVTVNPASGILAPATSNQSQTHGDDFDIDYYDASCDLIATVDDGNGGNVLGLTTSTVNVDPTANFHNGQPFVRRWYQITPTSNGSADVVIYINQSDFDDYNSIVTPPYLPMPTSGNNSDPNIPNIRITKNDDAGLGSNPIVITPTVNWNGNYWELSFNTLSFSQFRVHSVNPGNIPLPVVLTNFDGKKLVSTDELTWTTGSEQNNAYFNLQHSTDGINFETIAKVNSKAINGNSATPLNYNAINSHPALGHNYYRLQQIDIDNKASIHAKIVDLIWGANGSTVNIYPNPTRDILNIDLYTTKVQNTTVKVLDMSGRTIKQVQAKSVAGMNNITISLGEFASGLYTVQVYENDLLMQTGKVRKND